MVSREVAIKNNFSIVYEPKDNTDDISDIIISELNNKTDIDVEKYFDSIK